MGCATSKPIERAASFVDPLCRECSGGNLLKDWEFKSQFKATSCDKCHKDIERGATVYGCRKCNYDECADCFQSGNPQMEDIPELQGIAPAQQV